jgi:aminoglycoside/choline kinase family phosphotransferase
MEEFIQSFLKQSLKSDDFKVYSLAGDASNRRYYRVILDHQSWVLMRWEPFDPENYPFLSVLQHFAKADVHVPEVVYMAPDQGLVLLEDFGDTARKEINRIFLDICSKLDREPKKIAHRDYHSRNLMIKLDTMKVIDFQDARLGPIQYDLVSLFKDSYVDMNADMTKSLMEYYLESSKEFLPKDFSRAHFDEIYELQSIQRCFKACGSFASFYNLRSDKRYLKYLSGTLRRVLKSLTEFPDYKPFADILIDSGALERKYEQL